MARETSSTANILNEFEIGYGKGSFLGQPFGTVKLEKLFFR